MMVFVVIWLVFAAVASWLGASKGRALLGFFLGFFLGVIGLIITFLVPARATHPNVWQQRKNGIVTCPWCSEPNLAHARICGSCLRSVAPSAPPPLLSRQR